MKKVFIFSLVLVLTANFAVWSSGKQEPGEAAAEPSVVTIWHHWSSTSPQGQGFEQMVEQYNSTQSKYKVDALFMAGAQAAGGLIQKLLTSVAAGDPPDISTSNAFWVPRLKGADAIFAIEDLLPADEAEALFKDQNMMGEFFNIDGKHMAWLVNQRGAALVFNTELFEKAGLDAQNPPVTWDDVIAQGKKLTDPDAGQYGFRMFSDVQQYTLIHWNYPLLAFGGQLMNADRTDVTFQEEAGVEALQMWVDFVHKHKISTVSEPPDAFLAGKIGLDIQEIGILAQRDSLGFKLGVGELPLKKRRGFYTAGQSMVVFKDAKNKEGAVEFLKWFTSPEIATRFAMTHDNFPARKSGVDLPFYREYLANDPDYIPFAKSLEYSFPKPNVIPFLGIQLEVAKQIEKAMFQKATPKQALDEAAKIARQKLAE